MQGEYSEFLSNQMKEKEFAQSVMNQEKRSFQENMRIKHQLQEQKNKLQERERLESQNAYRNVLHNQQMYKNEHPESTLKVNETGAIPTGITPINTGQRHMSNPEADHYSNSSPARGSQGISHKIDQIPPVSANQGKFFLLKL